MKINLLIISAITMAVTPPAFGQSVSELMSQGMGGGDSWVPFKRNAPSTVKALKQPGGNETVGKQKKPQPKEADNEQPDEVAALTLPKDAESLQSPANKHGSNLYADINLLAIESGKGGCSLLFDGNTPVRLDAKDVELMKRKIPEMAGLPITPGVTSYVVALGDGCEVLTQATPTSSMSTGGTILMDYNASAQVFEIAKVRFKLEQVTSNTPQGTVTHKLVRNTEN